MGSRWRRASTLGASPPSPRGVFAQVMDDRAGGADGLRVGVEAKAGRVRRRQIVRGGCVRRNRAERSSLRGGFRRRLRHRGECLWRSRRVAEGGEAGFRAGGAAAIRRADSSSACGPGKFGGEKFAGGEIDEGQADGGCRALTFVRTAARKLFSRASRTATSVAVPGVMTRKTSRRTSFLPGPGCSICSQMATLKPARIRRAM